MCSHATNVALWSWQPGFNLAYSPFCLCHRYCWVCLQKVNLPSWWCYSDIPLWVIRTASFYFPHRHSCLADSADGTIVFCYCLCWHFLQFSIWKIHVSKRQGDFSNKFWEGGWRCALYIPVPSYMNYLPAWRGEWNFKPSSFVCAWFTNKRGKGVSNSYYRSLPIYLVELLLDAP